MLTSLVIAALEMAIQTRRPHPGTLVHHSDRGLQYACSDYTDILNTYGILTSMSRVANPYDNAKAESFMKTLKAEEVNGKAYATLAHARRDIGRFIDTIYNTQRLHSALSYRPPAEFEALHRASLGPGVGDAARSAGFAPPTPNHRLDPQPHRQDQ